VRKGNNRVQQVSKNCEGAANGPDSPTARLPAPTVFYPPYYLLSFAIYSIYAHPRRKYDCTRPEERI
jgi:hypothetical protein